MMLPGLDLTSSHPVGWFLLLGVVFMVGLMIWRTTCSRERIVLEGEVLRFGYRAAREVRREDVAAIDLSDHPLVRLQLVRPVPPATLERAMIDEEMGDIVLLDQRLDGPGPLGPAVERWFNATDGTPGRRSSVSERAGASAGEVTARGRRLRGALSIDRWARWTRRLANLAAAVAVLAALVAAAAAFRALAVVPAVIVSAVCAVPALVALLLRARAIWLVDAIPDLLAELRTIADPSDESEGSARHEAFEVIQAQADEVEALVAGARRRSVRGMYRVFKLLRSPTVEATKMASKHLGDRAAASLSTTTGAATRLAGIVPLMWLAGLGTFAVSGVALVLLVVGTF
jgi:hypothetical protein